MKQLWHKLMGRLLETVGRALRGIACLHEMGLSPLGKNYFPGMVNPINEEARYMVGLAHLKHMDEVAHSEHG